jgi:flagellar protein FliS
MISAQATAQRYQQVQFATIDRGRLLLLMFDGGLKFLVAAEQALVDGDVAQFAHQLGRAQAVIAELLHTLDHDRGGAIAHNLERLYRFMLDHLVEANLRKSAAHVGAVHRLLDVVASGYREILAGGLPKLDAA